MRLANRNGEIATIVIVAYVVLAAIAGAIFYKPVTSLLPSNQPQKIQKDLYKKAESKPVLMGYDSQGKPIMGEATKQEESTHDLSQDAPVSLWQKIKNLGLVIVILVIVGILVFGIAPFVALWAWFKKKWSDIQAELQASQAATQDSRPFATG